MLSTFTTVGSIGILANHEPLLALLEPTELRLYRSEHGDRALRAGRGLPAVRREPCAGARRGGDRAGADLTVPPSRAKLVRSAGGRRAGRAGQRGARPGAARRQGATRHSSRSGSRGRRGAMPADDSVRHRPLRAQAPRLVHGARLQPPRRALSPGSASACSAPACSRFAGAARASRGARRSTCSTLDGERYLVAPRGKTQWARNLRASGEGRLLVGQAQRDLHRRRARRRREGAGAARLPEALEVRGRRVLRRRRTGLLR